MGERDYTADARKISDLFATAVRQNDWPTDERVAEVLAALGADERAKALREAADRLRHRAELHGLAGEPGFGRLLEALERGLRAMADEAKKGSA